MTSRTFTPTPAFRKKEEQLRQSIFLETKEKLQNDMLKLFKDAQYCDVILVAQSNELPVHSFIVETRFPEFYKYIQNQPDSCRINIPEVKFAELEEWVKTLYSEDHINHAFIKEALGLNEEKKENEQASGEKVSLPSDMLSLLNESNTGDVEFSVGQKTIKAHKAILAVRDDYFGAMFSSSWREASQSNVTIPDVSYEMFLASLKFIYGVAQDILSFPTTKVFRFADMYGMQDLVDLVVAADLKITKCHLFHKPCEHCIPQVYECLKLCEDFYQAKNFQLQCIQWISKHFQKTLACRHFPRMSENVQNAVRQEIHKQISPSTALLTWLKCSTMITSLKNLNTSWSQTVVKFVEEIRQQCLKIIEENFPAVSEFSNIAVFIKEIRNSSSVLEQFLNEILERLTVVNCCYILQGLQNLIDRVTAMDEDESHFCNPFDSESLQVVQECLKRCEKFVIGRIGPVSKTTAWKDISSSKKQELKSSAFFVDL